MGDVQSRIKLAVVAFHILKRSFVILGIATLCIVGVPDDVSSGWLVGVRLPVTWCCVAWI